MNTRACLPLLAIALPLLDCSSGGEAVPAAPSDSGATSDAAPSDAADGDAGAGTTATAPSAETRALWEQLKDYATWPQHAEHAEPKRSAGHENMWVVTFHNEIVTKALADKTLPLPEGSIFVKENRPEPDAAPMVLTVMHKKGGEWYWVKGLPDGRVATSATGEPLEGAVEGCIGCHMGGAPSNDGVFTHDFSK